MEISFRIGQVQKRNKSTSCEGTFFFYSHYWLCSIISEHIKYIHCHLFAIYPSQLRYISHRFIKLPNHLKFAYQSLVLFIKKSGGTVQFTNTFLSFVCFADTGSEEKSVSQGPDYCCPEELMVLARQCRMTDHCQWQVPLAVVKNLRFFRLTAEVLKLFIVISSFHEYRGK